MKPLYGALGLANPHHSIPQGHVSDFTVELVQASVEDEQGALGRSHEVLSKQATAGHDAVFPVPAPLGWRRGLFEALDHFDVSGAELHEQGIRLLA